MYKSLHCIYLPRYFFLSFFFHFSIIFVRLKFLSRKTFSINPLIDDKESIFFLSTIYSSLSPLCNFSIPLSLSLFFHIPFFFIALVAVFNVSWPIFFLRSPSKQKKKEYSTVKKKRNRAVAPS